MKREEKNHTSKEIAIEVKSIWKSYWKYEGFKKREVKALKGVSFKVYQGEVFGLVGPNGAGKTTLLKILLGFLIPDEGEARLFGEPLGSISSRELLGFLPELPYFHDFIPASKLLRYLGKLDNVEGADYEGLLKYVGLSGFENYPLKSYSKGMKQRFGIAQTLLGNPPLLIFDEPTSGLDPLGQYEILSIIRRIKDEGGHTIFFTTHYLREVEILCDRIAVIHRGRILFEGPPDLLKEKYSGKGYTLKLYLLRDLKDPISKLKETLPSVQPLHEERGFLSLEEDKSLLWVHISEDDLRKLSQLPEDFEIRELSRDILSLEEAFFKLISEADQTAEEETEENERAEV